MTRRTYARRGVAAVAVAGLTLVGLSVGAAAASAAPTPGATALTPTYPDGATAPSMAPYGAVGYGLTTLNGADVDLTTNEPAVVSLPDNKTSSGSARFLSPPAASGQRVDRRFAGTFSYTVTNSTGGRSKYYLSRTGKLIGSPDQTPPVGTQHSDSWMWVGDTGLWTYTYDFSGLKDGVLPAGAVLSANDVDACESVFTTAEGATFSSDASGDWLEYWTDMGSGTPSVVSQQGSKYIVDGDPSCNSGADNMTETFKTTVPIHKLTVTLQGVVPDREGVGLWWELLAPTEPRATITTKATNKADGSKHVPSGGTVSDVITYSGLVPGTEYTVHGTLMDKATRKSTSVTTSKTFTPTSADGSVEVDFAVSRGFADDSLVAFDVISDVNGEVASHQDLDSAAQTVTVDAEQPVTPTPAADTGGATPAPAPASGPGSGADAAGPSVNTGGTVRASDAWAFGPAAAGGILLLGVAGVWIRQRSTARRQTIR